MSVFRSVRGLWKSVCAAGVRYRFWFPCVSAEYPLARSELQKCMHRARCLAHYALWTLLAYQRP
jgi:hypothetical protein